MPKQSNTCINSIYLGTVARNSSEFSETQISQLRSVAEQCPFEGGNAVYLARDLVALIDTVYGDYELNCVSSSRINHQSPVNDEKDGNHISVFPNPTNGVIYIIGAI